MEEEGCYMQTGIKSRDHLLVPFCRNPNAYFSIAIFGISLLETLLFFILLKLAVDIATHGKKQGAVSMSW